VQATVVWETKTAKDGETRLARGTGTLNLTSLQTRQFSEGCLAMTRKRSRQKAGDKQEQSKEKKLSERNTLRGSGRPSRTKEETSHPILGKPKKSDTKGRLSNPEWVAGNRPLPSRPT